MSKQNVFLDSDILLDVIFEREPHFKDSQHMLALTENNQINGYTSSLIIANCFYIIQNNFSIQKAKNAIQKLQVLLTILPFTNKEIDESLNSNIKDFEDGIQYFIATNNKIKIIITRNIKDYKKADCEVLTPSDYLNFEKIKKVI